MLTVPLGNMNACCTWKIRYFALFAALMLLCAPPLIAKKYENKQYKVSADQLPLKLAIIPIAYDDDDVKITMDTVFEKMYTDTGLVIPIPPTDLRQRIYDDSSLASLLLSIVKYEYTKEQRKSGPSLSQVLDSSQIAYLISVLERPDLLLVPMKFGVGSLLGVRTGGKLSLRLYDMHTGELIYEKDQDLNVDLTGKAGRDYLLLGLVAFTRDPYHKFLLDQLEMRKSSE